MFIATVSPALITFGLLSKFNATCLSPKLAGGGGEPWCCAAASGTENKTVENKSSIEKIPTYAAVFARLLDNWIYLADY
jgi:hypothetical protein